MHAQEDAGKSVLFDHAPKALRKRPHVPRSHVAPVVSRHSVELVGYKRPGEDAIGCVVASWHAIEEPHYMERSGAERRVTRWVGRKGRSEIAVSAVACRRTEGQP